MKHWLLSFAFALALVGAAHAGKPDHARGHAYGADKAQKHGHIRVELCHWDEIEDDALTVDVDESLQSGYELIIIPRHAADKHLAKHAEDTVDLIAVAADADGDGLFDPDTLAEACDVPDGYMLVDEAAVADDDDTVSAFDPVDPDPVTVDPVTDITATLTDTGALITWSGTAESYVAYHMSLEYATDTNSVAIAGAMAGDVVEVFAISDGVWSAGVTVQVPEADVVPDEPVVDGPVPVE